MLLNSISPNDLTSFRRPHAAPTVRFTSNFAAKTVLDIDDGPLVWIDCEMTGLNPNVDKVMEIAVIITNGNLEPVDEGISHVIKVEEMSLARMDDWCTRQHGLSGLTQQCQASPHMLPDVAKAVLSYIQKHIPQQRVGVLAGNSVHVDGTFLASQMPEVVKWLHYRIVDVSSIKELCRRWYPGVVAPLPSQENIAHRALEDIKGSIRELQWYRENIFVPPSLVAPQAPNAAQRENSLGNAGDASDGTTGT